MITKENYFSKVKAIKFGALPKELQKRYLFTQEATEEHTTWEHYEEDPDVSVPIDDYIKSLNDFYKQSSVIEFTEQMALDCAKDLIRSYVHRGDSLESLKSGQMGSYNGTYGASIRSGKILVTEIKNHKVDFSFSLEKVFNEVSAEKRVPEKTEAKQTGTSPQPKKTKPIKNLKMKPAPKKPTSKSLPPATQKKPLRIDSSQGKQVERIEDEVKFIKRFLSLHNRSKTKQQILSFINALQRSILEKRIRKTSKYSDEIMQIQKQLVAGFNIMKDGDVFKVSDATIKKFTEIAESVRVRISTQYLKRYIGIRGKTLTKEKAKNLVDLVLKGLERSKIATSDPYYKNIQNIVKALEKFIDLARTGDTLAVHQEALQGLNGVLSCACLENESEDLKGIETEQENSSEQEPEQELETETESVSELSQEPDVMTTDQARKIEFEPVNITGKWLKLIGKFCLPTSFFVFGSGGSGKTSFVLLFTQYLASLGYKILYVAGEQFNTPTFTELLNRLNIVGGENFKIVGKMETLNPADFHFVVLDSKDALEIDTKDYLKLKAQFPEQSFIVIPHSIKSGKFKGKEQWRNIMEVMIEGTNGVIRTGHDKNRWGGAGEMRVFEPPFRNPVAA